MKRPQKILMAFIAFAGSCFAAAERATLDKVFAEPPARSGINVWWHWQGANVTKYGITRDLESMKKAGVASATIFNIQDVGWDSKERFKDPFCPGMTYMSPEWFEMVGFAVREAKRLGLEIGLHNCPGYSTSGGPWIAPALGMKKLVWTKGTSQPETKLGFYRDIATVETTNGVYRFGYTCTGKCTHPSPPEMERASLEADKMSLVAIDTHLDHLLDNLKSHGLAPSKPGLSFILMDSYEAQDSSWTDDFAEEFRRRRGYDPIPFLPVMAGLGTSAGAAKDEQFRRDFTRTKNELQTERHYRRFKERLNAAGFEFHLEPYWGPFDRYEASQYCDVPMSEFWEGTPFWGRARYPGGRADVYGAVGRALGRNLVGAESFTGYPLDDPFALTPRDLKRALDATFARGVNRLSLHHWEHQPLNEKWKPGFSMGPWGTHFGENQTWFEPGLPFYRYMHRVQAMMQAGERRIDDLGVGFILGEDSDALPYSNFLTNVAATAEGKVQVRSSGRTYAMLTVDPAVMKRINAPWDALEARVLAKVEALKKSGVPVCGDGNKVAALRRIGLAPLVEIAGGVSDPNLLPVNARRLGDTAFWFVANIDTKAVDCTLRLRLLESGAAALEAWDPETGAKGGLVCQIADGVATVSLHLAPESSLFVVARTRPPARDLRRDVGVRRTPGAAEVLGADGWTLTFAPGGGAPSDAVKLSALKSWTAFDDPGIRYYSGTATYETAFKVPASGRYELDLGEVRDLAEVAVDDRPVTTLWHRPYRTVLSLDAGSHRLTVKVTNAWTNRLIGDEKEPDDCVLAKEMAGFGPSRNRIKEFIPIGRPVVEVPAALRTNGARTVNRFAFSTWRYNLTDKDLRPAGLIGPVSLAPLARWRGFNLMEMFTWWPKHEKPAYREDDFRFIRENGFNFVRLPIDYRFWTHGGDWTKIDAEWVKPVDDAIELGGKYGIHVQINLHRGPGYCVNRGETEPKKLFGPEASEEARKVFAQHWEFLAKRYAKYPNARVSFDLINEPADVSEKEYVAAVRPAIAAIRAVSPDRLIFSDGRAWGNRPTHLLADDPNIAQAMRGYQPMTVSHYQANWVRLDPNAKPVWPPAPAAKKAKYDDPGLDWLYTHNFKAWDELAAKGVLVMMGEFGIFNKTPHDVSLAALEDNLRMLKERDWGWALWNLRGTFGPIDSGRSDVEYEDMNGHKLDRKMLELLKRY
ncbi:MAG: cellulase family glycosylhydrolase [Kiritimatiellae bacterium]|nr:cellulase family glycosylhydrolase [Kiritimatiellia bacterium]